MSLEEEGKPLLRFSHCMVGRPLVKDVGKGITSANYKLAGGEGMLPQRDFGVELPNIGGAESEIEFSPEKQLRFLKPGDRLNHLKFLSEPHQGDYALLPTPFVDRIIET